MFTMMNALDFRTVQLIDIVIRRLSDRRDAEGLHVDVRGQLSVISYQLSVVQYRRKDGSTF